MRRLMRRLWHAIRHRQLDADLAEEIDFHHALRQRDFDERGLDPKWPGNGCLESPANATG